MQQQIFSKVCFAKLHFTLNCTVTYLSLKMTDYYSVLVLVVYIVACRVSLGGSYSFPVGGGVRLQLVSPTDLSLADFYIYIEASIYSQQQMAQATLSCNNTKTQKKICNNINPYKQAVNFYSLSNDLLIVFRNLDIFDFSQCKCTRANTHIHK